MAKSTVHRIKSFNNVDEVFDKMLELDFFANKDHMEESKAELREPKAGPFSNSEYWYSNGVVEFKIFRGLFGAFEICNFHGQIHATLDTLFELAEIPKQ